MRLRLPIRQRNGNEVNILSYLREVNWVVRLAFGLGKCLPLRVACLRL
jgi:hypothetical protein